MGTGCRDYICHRNSRTRNSPICPCSNRCALRPFHRAQSKPEKSRGNYSLQYLETECIAASSWQEERTRIAVLRSQERRSKRVLLASPDNPEGLKGSGPERGRSLGRWKLGNRRRCHC